MTWWFYRVFAMCYIGITVSIEMNGTTEKSLILGNFQEKRTFEPSTISSIGGCGVLSLLN